MLIAELVCELVTSNCKQSKNITNTDLLKTAISNNINIPCPKIT